MNVVLLGTGTSHGVPVVGCACPTCTSTDPRDRRNRTGVHIECDGRGILIDTPPELRLQCLAHGVRRVDAVFYTHAHADHILGLDDLQPFNWRLGASIPCHGNPETLSRIEHAFPYAFGRAADSPVSAPSLRLQPIDGPVRCCGLEIVPVPVHHGDVAVLGYRIGPFAFLTDFNRIPDASRACLEGLEVLVLGALRPRPHPTHFSLTEAVAEARRIGARRTYFTHMTHELKHAETDAALPPGMALAYDGLRFAF
ncbi:MAG: MBL fold metallo-hydrolase [Planctomycetes bacterium]|nr:MBL fold metallo-hydrolase [Planctomycetota bacterium]